MDEEAIIEKRRKERQALLAKIQGQGSVAESTPTFTNKSFSSSEPESESEKSSSSDSGSDSSEDSDSDSDSNSDGSSSDDSDSNNRQSKRKNKGQKSNDKGQIKTNSKKAANVKETDLAASTGNAADKIEESKTKNKILNQEQSDNSMDMFAEDFKGNDMFSDNFDVSECSQQFFSFTPLTCG